MGKDLLKLDGQTKRSIIWHDVASFKVPASCDSFPIRLAQVKDIAFAMNLEPQP